MSTIGEIIKSARKAKGLTQEELANRVGVQKSAIAKWENGRVSEIKRSNLKALSIALGLNPNVLLSSSEDARPAAPAALAEDEQELIFLYRELNEEGQEKLLEYADDLVASGKYIKNCSLGMVEA